MGLLFPFTSDEMLPEAAVREIMQPVFGCLASAQLYGWGDWTGKVSPDVQNRVTAMQRGGTVYDIMVSHAVELLASSAPVPTDIEVDTKLGFAQFYIANKVVARFRKLRKNGIVSWRNLKPQGKRWYANNAMSGVRSWCTRVTVGYILDPIERAIEDVLISCQFKDMLLWKFSILENAKTIAFPNETQDPTLPAQTIIRARKDDSA
jgi:hypothetical protein